MEEELKKIGNRIKSMRKACNLTQKQLADILDISVTNMCNIENGKTAVTIQNLIKLKNCFSCELKDFFIDEVNKSESDNKVVISKQMSEVAEATDDVKAEDKPEVEKLPESIDLQDAINLLRLLRRIDIKGI